MSKNRSNYEKTAYYRGLILEHTLDEYGVWEVRGEDQNPDLGGSHHTPFLGRFEGILSDIIDYAVELPSFWTWGGGGEIKKALISRKSTTKPTSKGRSFKKNMNFFPKSLKLSKKNLIVFNYE